MNVESVLLWGFVGTVMLTTIMAASQGLGLTRMSIPYLLGTMLTPDRDRAMLAGFTVHIFNGWVFAGIYALAFESWGQATWWNGAGIGVIHGTFVLLAGMNLLPAMHPRMASESQGPTPTRQLQPPGFLALNYGRRTPVVTLIAHIVYGVLIGAFYQVSG
jgi:hypothetical protein